MFKRICLISLIIATTLTCGPGRSSYSGAEAPMHQKPTLAVWNRTADHISLYIDGRKEAVITQGPHCIALDQATQGRQRVSLRATAGETVHTEIHPNLGSHRGWKLELFGSYRLEADLRLNLEPARRCK